VTGTRADLSSAAEELVNRTRKFTDLPIAVGFGVSTNDHVRDVWKYADAAVVGSAIVEKIHRERDSDDLIGEVADFVKELII
ncbi:MAG: tryptophan synthase subunit alpha, partial [Acidobacteria bacterium]|nr:tryptophan synthase subunit alpha [Acidobacteriota bacterium]